MSYFSGYRISLENKLNIEKANNNIYNNEKNNLERELNELKMFYSNKIKELENNIGVLTVNNNNIIIRKDNMKNILYNNVKAIEPKGYSKTLLIENFDTNCPYSSSRSGSRSFSGISGVSRSFSKNESKVVYDPIPYYSVDLQNEKDKASTNSINSFYKNYKYIFDQNSILLQRQQYINDQFTRHNNKYEYYSNYVTNLKVFNNILFYLYYILVFIVFYKIFFDTPEWSIYYKIILIIVLLVFPLIVYTIEMIIYNTWLLIYSFMYGNVYNNLSYSNKVVLNNTTDLTTK